MPPTPLQPIKNSLTKINDYFLQPTKQAVEEANQIIHKATKYYQSNSSSVVYEGEKILSTSVKQTKGIYAPVSVTILTGKFAGLNFAHMGANIQELDISQEAEWEEKDESGIRTGGHFKKISPREISFSIDYYSDQGDIATVVENWSHLHELSSTPIPPTTTNRQPPLILLKIGQQKYSNTVLTSFNPKYDEPLPGRAGFRHCVVSLAFKSFGGETSIYRLAPPYAPTAMQKYVSEEPLNQREKRGRIGAIVATLQDCIKGSDLDKVKKIIDLDKINDPNSYKDLSSEAFVQVAVSGMMANLIKTDESLQEKLKTDLSNVLAKKEPGLSPDEQFQLAKALESNGTPPSGNLTQIVGDTSETLYDQIKVSYDTIYDDIVNDKLNQTINSQDKADITERINKIGSCGVVLLQNNMARSTDIEEADQTLIKTINTFLSIASDEEIIEAFGIPEGKGQRSRLNTIKNGTGYADKTEFINHATDSKNGYDGRSAISAFGKWQSTTLSDLNNFLSDENTNVDAIKTKLGVNDETANKILAQKPYGNLDKFYAKAGGQEDGSKYLYNFYKNKESPSD